MSGLFCKGPSSSIATTTYRHRPSNNQLTSLVTEIASNKIHDILVPKFYNGIVSVVHTEQFGHTKAIFTRLMTAKK